MTNIVSPPVALPVWAESAINLASPRLGTEAVACSDDSFAPMARMLADAAPAFKPDVFDDYGKWMDGWESKRRRDGGHDWLIVALGAPGIVERIEVATAHFKGNFPDRCSLQAARVDWGTDASLPTQAMFWPQLMDEQKLKADAIHVFEGDDIGALGPVSHVKLNIHPDGGISRLRIFGRRA